MLQWQKERVVKKKKACRIHVEKLICVDLFNPLHCLVLNVKTLSVTEQESVRVIKAEETAASSRISIELQFVSNCTELSC